MFIIINHPRSHWTLCLITVVAGARMIIHYDSYMTDRGGYHGGGWQRRAKASMDMLLGDSFATFKWQQCQVCHQDGGGDCGLYAVLYSLLKTFGVSDQELKSRRFLTTRFMNNNVRPACQEFLGKFEGNSPTVGSCERYTKWLRITCESNYRSVVLQ